MQDCSWDEIEYYGKRYRVEGECNTDICGAMCCKVMDWTGKVGGPCEYLDTDLKCKLHKQDIHCKPISCLLWPIKKVDIIATNALAERFNMPERCLLKVVEIGNN